MCFTRVYDNITVVGKQEINCFYCLQCFFMNLNILQVEHTLSIVINVR